MRWKGIGTGWDTGRDGYGKASRKTNFEIQAFREPRDPPAFPYILCIPGGVAAVDGGGYSGWVGGGWGPYPIWGMMQNVQIFPRRRSLTLRDLKMGWMVEGSYCCFGGVCLIIFWVVLIDLSSFEVCLIIFSNWFCGKYLHLGETCCWFFDFDSNCCKYSIVFHQ